jgi:biotin synthase
MEKRELLERLTAHDTETLFTRAAEVMRAHVGTAVYMRGLVEFSNFCVNNCLYCGLRRDNGRLRRYRMSSAEILHTARRIAADGLKTVVLQSGDDPFYSAAAICRIVEAIKKIDGDLAVTLSVGERPLSEYAAFRKSGADRFLLKHETINPALYRRLHPGQSLKRRLKILSYLKKLGFQAGTGVIVGLPGQSPEDLADDILFMAGLEPDMIGIGPFLPQKQTPLHDSPHGTAELTLRVLALVRLTNPLAHMPVTTALHTLDPDRGLYNALRTGCNVIMPDYTPASVGRHYTIYDNKQRIRLRTVRKVCSELRREVSLVRGDSLLPCMNSA